MPQRRTIRLPGFDYAQSGAYFMTICAFERQCLFGEIDDAGMRVSTGGRIANECWQNIPVHYPRVALDQYVIMPNHVQVLSSSAMT